MKFFDENSADKIQFKKDTGIKVPPLMPIRVRLSFEKKPIDDNSLYKDFLIA